MRKVLISFVSRDAKRKHGWNFLFQLDKGNERLTRMNFYSSYPDYRVEIGIESDRIRSKLYAIRDLRDFNPILLRARFPHKLSSSSVLCNFFFFFHLCGTGLYRVRKPRKYHQL